MRPPLRGRLHGLFLSLIWLGVMACGGSVEGWTEEGDRLLRSNDLAGAEKAYNRALEKDPHYAPAVYGKGWSLYASGFDDLEDTARRLFDRAIDYDPEFFGGYRGRGVLLLETGNIPAAEDFLRKAYERAPEEPTVVESMGQLYLRAGHLEPARRVFEQAVELAPERGELRRFLADVALAQGNFELALAELEKGRRAPLSGRRGLLLLEEGEVYVHTAAAQALLEGKLGGKGRDVAAAGAALDSAEVVAGRMDEAGFQREASSLRLDRILPLRKRIAEGSDVLSVGGPTEPSASGEQP